MKRRFRFISGALMLAALALSLAEGAWAPTCALEMEMETGMPGMEMPIGESSTATHDSHDSRSGANHNQETPPTEAPECPLGLPAGSCVSPATLPIATIAQLPSSFEHDVATLSPDVLPKTLVRTAVFHPPKA